MSSSHHGPCTFWTQGSVKSLGRIPSRASRANVRSPLFDCNQSFRSALRRFQETELSNLQVLAKLVHTEAELLLSRCIVSELPWCRLDSSILASSEDPDWKYRASIPRCVQNFANGRRSWVYEVVTLRNDDCVDQGFSDSSYKEVAQIIR